MAKKIPSPASATRAKAGAIQRVTRLQRRRWLDLAPAGSALGSRRLPDAVALEPASAASRGTRVPLR